jgi:hypothetical protein
VHGSVDAKCAGEIADGVDASETRTRGGSDAIRIVLAPEIGGDEEAPLAVPAELLGQRRLVPGDAYCGSCIASATRS